MVPAGLTHAQHIRLECLTQANMAHGSSSTHIILTRAEQFEAYIRTGKNEGDGKPTTPSA